MGGYSLLIAMAQKLCVSKIGQRYTQIAKVMQFLARLSPALDLVLYKSHILSNNIANNVRISFAS